MPQSTLYETSSNRTSRSCTHGCTCITAGEAQPFLFIMSGQPFVVLQVHIDLTHRFCAPNRTPRQHHRAREQWWQALSWVRKTQFVLSTNTEPWPYEMHLLAEGCFRFLFRWSQVFNLSECQSLSSLACAPRGLLRSHQPPARSSLITRAGALPVCCASVWLPGLWRCVFMQQQTALASAAPCRVTRKWQQIQGCAASSLTWKYPAFITPERSQCQRSELWGHFPHIMSHVSWGTCMDRPAKLMGFTSCFRGCWPSPHWWGQWKLRQDWARLSHGPLWYGPWSCPAPEGLLFWILQTQSNTQESATCSVPARVAPLDAVDWHCSAPHKYLVQGLWHLLIAMSHPDSKWNENPLRQFKNVTLVLSFLIASIKPGQSSYL